MKLEKAMPRSVLALALSVALGRCGAASPEAPVPVLLGEEFELRPGQAVVVTDEDLQITFEGIANDSRCPTGVVCIWEGDATARLRVRLGGSESEMELHTNPSSAQRATVGGYQVALLRVAPYPTAGQSIPAGDYRATLEVTRGVSQR